MDVVALYNLALGKVGTRTTVSATTEGSNESNSCNAFYASVRDSMLRGAPWNFARKQALLTQLKSSRDVPNTCPAPWAYEYAYPNDCLRTRYLLPQLPVSTDVGGVPIDSTGASALPISVMGPPIKFIISLDTDSSGNNIRVILSNQFQAQLIYTVGVTDPNLFDPEFVEAVTSALAAKVAMNITGDKDLTKYLRMEAVDLLNQARASNGSEGLEVINPTPDWMRIRGYEADYQPIGYSDFDSLFQIA